MLRLGLVAEEGGIEESAGGERRVLGGVGCGLLVWVRWV